MVSLGSSATSFQVGVLLSLMGGGLEMLCTLAHRYKIVLTISTDFSLNCSELEVCWMKKNKISMQALFYI